jgi:hypothetical protein
LDREIPAARILLETLVHRVNSPVIHVARWAPGAGHFVPISFKRWTYGKR